MFFGWLIFILFIIEGIRIYIRIRKAKRYIKRIQNIPTTMVKGQIIMDKGGSYKNKKHFNGRCYW